MPNIPRVFYHRHIRDVEQLTQKFATPGFMISNADSKSRILIQDVERLIHNVEQMIHETEYVADY